MSELTTYAAPTGTALTIGADQARFTDPQIAVLRHLGVEGATAADLDVFFHQCKRTGLDPFVRQIYMISRESSEKDGRGQWVKVIKQTIQTGIDGYRLIARRAADRSGEGYSLTAPQWADRNGGWREVWSKEWGFPIACRLTVTRAGQPFTAVALFDEYVQTKRDGNPTRMWEQRPAGQLAKCCEALALRMAFPQDLAGLYTDDELGEPQPVETVEVQRDTKPARVSRAKPPAPVVEEPPLDEPLEVDAEPDPITDAQQRKMHALLREVGHDRESGLAFISGLLGREVDTTKALTKADAGRVIDALELSLAGGAE